VFVPLVCTYTEYKDLRTRSVDFTLLCAGGRSKERNRILCF